MSSNFTSSPPWHFNGVAGQLCVCFYFSTILPEYIGFKWLKKKSGNLSEGENITDKPAFEFKAFTSFSSRRGNVCTACHFLAPVTSVQAMLELAATANLTHYNTKTLT
jgi:hypothetical protein